MWEVNIVHKLPAFLKHVLLFCFVCLGVPATAEANMGTPLIWVGAGQLLLGNWIIGIIEGVLIGFVFRVNKLLAVFLMITANYFSMFIGAVMLALFSPVVKILVGLNPVIAFVVIVGVLFILTVLIEMPFCLWIVSGELQDRWRRAFKASLIAQSVSYAILLLFYAPAFFMEFH